MEMAINQCLSCICQQSGMDIQHHLRLLKDMKREKPLGYNHSFHSDLAGHGTFFGDSADLEKKTFKKFLQPSHPIGESGRPL